MFFFCLDSFLLNIFLREGPIYILSHTIHEFKKTIKETKIYTPIFTKMAYKFRNVIVKISDA